MHALLGAVDKLSFVQYERTVHALGEFEIVGCDESGQPLRVYQLDERVEYASGCAAVEISGGLVRQQDSRAIGECPRHGDPLLLAP